MKTWFRLAVVTLGVMTLGVLLTSVSTTGPDQSPSSAPGKTSLCLSEFSLPAVPDIPRCGPEWQRKFFADWHEPYGNGIPAEVTRRLWNEAEALGSSDAERSATSWSLVGPTGMHTPAGAYYSGRILDLDTGNGPFTIAAASGGLWRYDLFIAHPVSDALPTQWTSTFAIDPQDQNTILLGTGEFWIQSGEGIYRTTDNGATWSACTMSSVPWYVNRIRFDRNPQIVHAATSSGYFRSTDRGVTWNLLEIGVFTDVALVPVGNYPGQTMYLTTGDGDVLRSLDHGQTWADVGSSLVDYHDTAVRGAVAVCPANFNVVYVSYSQEVEVGDDTTYPMLGVWKSMNAGSTWTEITPPSNFMGGQGWYNNVISVCPTDPDLVFAGGVTLMRSQDGGQTWDHIQDDHLHNDYHALQWSEDGTRLWAGHDGGFSYSSNRGEPGSWSSTTNHLPITQFTEIDAGGISWPMAALCGGSQDNSICTSYDGGSTWNYLLGGDGGGLEFGSSSQDLWIRLGVYSDDWAFHSHRTQDGGGTWQDNTTGLAPADTWYPALRRDGDGVMYTHSGPAIFSRNGTDTQWNEETLGGGFDYTVKELTVSPVSGHPIIWVCLDNSGFPKIAKKDGNYWYLGGWDFPANGKVRKIVPHPSDYHKAYALIDGMNTSGMKIYFTDNLGQSWINITGDLPNLPLADLVVHPESDDVLYLGTGGFGFFRSTDGGGHWQSWNSGIPPALVVTEMKTVDMRGLFNGGFHIVAGTYGRGIYRRDIEGDELMGPAAVPSNTIAADLHLAASPNPFNPSTTISFELPADSRVEVDIHDVAGRRLRTLTPGDLSAGIQRVTWDGRREDGSGVAAGIYLVTVRTGGGTGTLKVTLAK